jgi:hypothetical protein
MPKSTTAGPWSVQPGRVITDAHDNVVATCHARRNIVKGDVYDATAIHPVEADRNAYLVAAAPALAATVRLLLDTLRDYDSRTVPPALREKRVKVANAAHALLDSIGEDE